MTELGGLLMLMNFRKTLCEFNLGIAAHTETGQGWSVGFYFGYFFLNIVIRSNPKREKSYGLVFFIDGKQKGFQLETGEDIKIWEMA